MNEGTHFLVQPMYGQLISLLDKAQILRISQENGGERYVKHFDAWQHLVVVPEFGLSNSPFSFDDFDIKRRLFGQETICGHGCHEIRGKSSDAPVARVFNLNDVLQFVVHRLDQRPFSQ